MGLPDLDASRIDTAQVKVWETTLNELGSEGWEAIAVVQQASGWYVLFKMPHEVGTY